MNQRAFLECEEEFAVVAVAVLLNGDANGLAGEGVLEFGCGDGEAVQAEQEIDGLLVLQAEMDLAGAK